MGGGLVVGSLTVPCSSTGVFNQRANSAATSGQQILRKKRVSQSSSQAILVEEHTYTAFPASVPPA